MAANGGPQERATTTSGDAAKLSADMSDRAHAGLDRRSLIKRAAAVGAAAWTAPVILGSLASPAGALTYGTCYFYVFKGKRNGNSLQCSNSNQLSVVDATVCSTSPDGVSACPTFTRITSDTTPVNFSTKSCTSTSTTGPILVTLTVDTCQIVAGATSEGGVCTAPTKTLNAFTPTTTAAFSTGNIGANGEFFVYVMVAC